MTTSRARSDGRRKTGVSKGRIRLGRHDERDLEAKYRLGGLTTRQTMRALGLSRGVARTVIDRQMASGLVDQTVDLARWQDTARGGQPPSFYYLSSRHGAVGVEYGATLAGVESRKDALKGYKRHQLPGRAAHSSLRNSYLLAVRENAGDSQAGASAPFSEMWGESHPEFPLAAGEADRRRAPRKNARKHYRDLYPDGRFEVAFDGGAPVTFMLEVETVPRGPDLLRKANDYGGWMHRARVLRPVLVLARTDRQAESMRALLDERIRAAAATNSEAVRHYGPWVRELRGRGVKAARLIAFASLQGVEEEGAFGAVYRPLAGEEKCVTLHELWDRTLEARKKLGLVEEVV